MKSKTCENRESSHSTKKKAISPDQIDDIWKRLKTGLLTIERLKKKSRNDKLPKKPFNQELISQTLGFSPSYISEILNEKVRKKNKTGIPPIDFLIALKIVFGLSINHILFGDLPMFIDLEKGTSMEKKEYFPVADMEPSIRVHYFPSMTMIEKAIANRGPEIKEAPRIDDFLDCKSGFIGFPNTVPFSNMAKRKMIMFYVDKETGMSPLIETSDIIMIDFDQTIIEEKQIYLVLYDGKLKLRYAEAYRSENKNRIILKPEENKFKTDIVFLSEKDHEKDHDPDPILGKVMTITKPFAGSMGTNIISS